MSAAADPARAFDAVPVRVRALGHLELLAPDGGQGRVIPIRSGRPRAALVALLTRVGDVVRADALVEAIWDGKRPEHADAALQTVLSRLRAHLRDAGLADALVTRQPGYLLQLEPAEFDVTRFRALALMGRSLLDEDPEAAARLLSAALDLWRGPAYAEFADAPFLVSETANLGETRHAAVEDLAEAVLRLGRPAEVIPLLENAIAEAPMRERPHRQLMLALHRTGRSVDALDLYRRFRAVLHDELGLEPSAELRALEAGILRQDPVLAPRRESREAALPPPVDRGSGNIPYSANPLIGAERTLGVARAAVSAAKCVTLTGPGGVGKTRVATAIAREAVEAGSFPDGVWLVDLAAIERGTPIAEHVLAALPVPPSAAEAGDRVFGYLCEQRVMLVLDSCEHVVEQVAEFAHALLQRCPEVALLTTSRVPLGVPGERIVPVEPLELPLPGPVGPDHRPVAAVRLFLDRARALAPRFTAEGTALADVAELCRRLDGIPLAIELAAGLMRSMSPAEVLRHLPDRMLAIRSPYRTSVERHRTLRTVVDWSYRLLDPEAQRLFHQLSVFSAAFALEDAAAVSGLDPLTAVERLADLVDRSMVVTAVDPVTGTMNYSMLEILRSFGRDRLAAAGMAETVRRAHLDHVLGVLGQGRAALRADRTARWAARVAASLDDVRAAFRWAVDHDLGAALRLLSALADWAELREDGDVEEWGRAAVAAWSDSGSPGDRPLAAVALGVAAGRAADRGDWAAADALSARSLDLLGPQDPRRRVALCARVRRAFALGEHAEALRAATEVLRMSELGGDILRAGRGSAAVVIATARLGGSADAIAAADRLLARAASPLERAWAAFAAAVVLVPTDSHRSEALLEGVRETAAAGDGLLDRLTSARLIAIWMAQGKPAQAAPLQREAVERRLRTGNRRGFRREVLRAALLVAHGGDPTLAYRLAVAAENAVETPLDADEREWMAGVVTALGGALPLQEGARMEDDDLLKATADALDRLAVP